MRELILHPDCQAGPVTSVSAEIHSTAEGCEAKFRIEGDVSAIKIPNGVQATRADNLWETTCFEIFWQAKGGDAYREFNLSPSSRWAAYDFDDFRLNSRDAQVGSISLACSHDGSALELTAAIASQLLVPASVALNAIVETQEGELQFWALAFDPGKPEFHSATCRALDLAGRL